MLGQSAAVGTVAVEVVGISGDSGSSAEGTLLGTPNEVAMFNGPRYRWRTSSSTSTTSGARTRRATTWRCPGRGRSTPLLLDQAGRVTLRWSVGSAERTSSI